MPITDLRKYLTNDTEVTAKDERVALYERANATQSTLRILNDELGCDVPENSRGISTKIQCPYWIEHSDPHDKNTRFYYESDHAFCFAVHGVIDAVYLRAQMWSCSRRKAAERMLEEAGLGAPVSWRERLSEARAEHERVRTRPASLENATAALTASLKTHPEYVRHQYDDAVMATLAGAQDTFDPLWDMDAVLSWIDTTVNKVLQVVGETT